MKPEADIDRLLDSLETRFYEQVAEAVDFARLDVVEQTLVRELEQLVAEGKLSAPPDGAVKARARSMIAWHLSLLGDDPRRSDGQNDLPTSNSCWL